MSKKDYDNEAIERLIQQFYNAQHDLLEKLVQQGPATLGDSFTPESARQELAKITHLLERIEGRLGEEGAKTHKVNYAMFIEGLADETRNLLGVSDE